MLQMIVAILSDPEDETEIRFLFANKTEKDILLRYTLDRLQAEHPQALPGALHRLQARRDVVGAAGASPRI